MSCPFWAGGRQEQPGFRLGRHGDGHISTHPRSLSLSSFPPQTWELGLAPLCRSTGLPRGGPDGGQVGQVVQTGMREGQRPSQHRQLPVH